MNPTIALKGLLCYEVMSGQLTAPGLSDLAEKKLMQEFASTYGKTWNLWQVDRGDPLPLGLPKLMMGFTADGQVDPALMAKRDRDLHIDSARVKAKRADFSTRPVAKGADGWQHGPRVDRGARWAPAEVGDAVRELLAKAPTPAPVYGTQ